MDAMDTGDELVFLTPDEEYKVLVTVEYPDELWEWCERQGGGNPNGYIFRLIREDMRRQGAAGESGAGPGGESGGGG